jgi:hypothetical protein
MPLNIEESAFHEAGARALRLTNFYGEEPACEIMRGYVRAYMHAIGSIEGWPEVEKLCREIRPAHRVPQKPTLVISNPDEVVPLSA